MTAVAAAETFRFGGMLRRLPSAVSESAQNAYGYARGGRKRLQPVGMTIDHDDVALARSLLRRQSAWRDREPVRRYEQAFAEWNGSAHAFAFMGGRKALTACIEALELLPGDEVIVPGFTCVLVPNALRFAGLRPIYCDIELDTYGPDLDSVRSRIGPRTRAILLQHLFGLVSRDYEAIIALAAERGLRVIEDCAQATGAKFKGRRVGTLGDVAFYSSERSKVYSTIVGGIAVTDNEKIADRLRRCATEWPAPSDDQVRRLLTSVIYDYFRFGHRLSPILEPLARIRFDWAVSENMSDAELAGSMPDDYRTTMAAPIAALGLNQLRKFDANLSRRIAGANAWRDWCLSQGYRPPTVVDGSEPVFLRYPVLVPPEMKADVSWARRLGVVPGVWFRTNIHPVPEPVPDCPNADRAVACCINMPTILEPR